MFKNSGSAEVADVKGYRWKKYEAAYTRLERAVEAAADRSRGAAEPHDRLLF